ncbi:uncharacterized protein C8A04DRAFT_25933 [Dichotomopilus funicola]|uniref:Uncharacterized protein n=1 Tax=Dichotomopilus funicola TaxID=1934379 RepID=A0AAN6ZR51_9PEZI|nr:hypothetical protein C8A04DRAFT_25933 [Dichotomopilus funicola]
MTDNRNPSTPEEVFHTTLTVVDFHHDTSGSTRDVYVLGTHTTLPAAKAFALSALSHLGYEPDDFSEYATRADTPSEAWEHGDGVLVYGKAPAGQEFLVGLDTKPNTESLPAGSDDTLRLPDGHDHLHYVLQNRTDYNLDKSGASQTTEILGCYVRRDAAQTAAKVALQADREKFEQYDDRDDVESDGEWPFGDEVLVHAVAYTGENYTVAVKTAPGAHKMHGKRK